MKRLGMTIIASSVPIIILGIVGPTGFFLGGFLVLTVGVLLMAAAKYHSMRVE